ncbi:MAG TPA: phosphoglucosamine mutase, partial [Bacteroidales bacterium]|nr:phosphoglucosamine mutase [Bacteroidales bacterium]
MTLIKSISGIRGTIGGKSNENLTPVDTVLFAASFAMWCKQSVNKEKIKVVVGRDARISGEMVKNLIVNTLVAYGADVVDIGLATTPTTEMAVVGEQADGGIIVTASHNPAQWNALKLLNRQGEFLNATEGSKILEMSEQQSFDFATVDKLGQVLQKDYLLHHIEKTLQLPLVKVAEIKKRKLNIVVDAINSVGAMAIPALLEQLGVENVIVLNGDANGHFAHNPEPLDEHLSQIKEAVVRNKADLGIVVDPDVDRLAFICEDGSMFGEEYTLVAVADYVLSKTPGTTVSNLSSSRALDDVSAQHGCSCFHSAVGEVNVVQMMKEKNAVIGGEGNGGVIYPELHYGRDALVGVALFLSYFVEKNTTMTQLKASFPQYYMVKNKIDLQAGIDIKTIREKLEQTIPYLAKSTLDGLRLDFAEGWVHIRPSNTEPIIRLYAEAKSHEKAKE